eukprot:jgi/Psemu1/262174/estExt_Genewise1Plus.C_7010008
MAARLIQTRWRCHVHRERYVTFTSSRLIQKQWRAYVCRKIYIENFAATMIQTKWRSYDCSSMYKRYCSARIIQKTWRSYDCQMNFLHFLADILIVQSTIRRFLVQRRVKAMKDRAATAIQREYRRYACLTSYKQTVAAITIQRTWRGFIEFLRMTRERHACTIIQKNWRRFWCFSNFIIALDCSIQIQAHVRGHIQNRKYSAQKFAAVAIQTAWRTANAKKVASQNKSQLKGAVLLQRIYRGFQARQRYWYTLGCAMQIQSWWRGRHTYHLVQNKLNAILTLQCFARCSLARQQYMQRRFVFMLIQTAEQERTKKIVALRMKEQVRDDMEERQRDEAARVIQRFFVNVKDEADELILATKRRKKWRKNMKRERHTDNVEEAFLEDVWLGLVAQNNFEEPFTRNYIDIGLDFGGKGSSRVPRHQIDDDDQSQFSLFEGAPARMTFKRHPNSSIQLVRKVDAIDLDDDFQLEEAFIDAEICNAKVLKNLPGINEGRKEYTTTLNSSMSVMKVDAESRNEKNQRGGIVTHKARVDDSHLGQNHQTQSNILTMSNHY